MEKITLTNGITLPVHTYQTIVVGTGCGAYNAADSLHSFGQTDICIVTEGVRMGTSRNTGSDKQTYYKLSLSGATPDSVYDLANVLYKGQSVHGDTALIEAALSAQCFYKLVHLGVPFPHDKYGQYVGYKTDHDPLQRATSCGPLTSKFMTEQLERAVQSKNIPIYDGFRVVSLVTEGAGDETTVVGLLAINQNAPEQHHGLTLFRATSVVYATGGPSGVYHCSVFPESQTCAHGAAFLAGAKGSNVVEWQYGIGSTKFRWNLSGTFQQVVPRYVSTAEDGSDEREFLDDFFETTGEMLSATFLKGYQWPFDPRKLQKGGSSIVDMAVYHEMQVKNRRVFLDFRRNPSAAIKNGEFDFSLLSEEAYTYLKNSNVLFGTPIERLLKMNPPAYDIYFNNGIDLKTELLEIAVCSQHNNGGLQADLWWRSNLRGLFPVGEACGNFGVYRPGGSALNATQVGGLRAAQYIAKRKTEAPVSEERFAKAAEPSVSALTDLCKDLLAKKEGKSPLDLRRQYQKEMDKCAAFIRNPAAIAEQIERVRGYLAAFTEETAVTSERDLLNAFINRDILVTQLVYLTAMQAYIAKGGGSRGSYLIDIGSLDFARCKTEGVIADLDEGRRAEIVQEVQLLEEFQVAVTDIPRRPLPPADAWFETIYNEYLNDNIIGS